ncbi:MAG: hypothetical protein GX552_16955 [Chloroflexi bacterium]|jgi:hypothetical protein|nr:hypothetical protein [Chloroflexota bacterium]
MNNRERLQAILRGESPDRIPWIPRVLLWYNARVHNNTMPAQWEGLSLREFEHALGIGTPARDGRIMRTVQEGVETVHRTEGGRSITEYHTPVGSLRTVVHFSETLNAQAMGGRVEEYPLKTAADYRVWEWIVEHTRWEPDYAAYEAYDAEIGGDGLPMVSVGDVPLHNWMLNLAGYDHAFYHLADYTKEVEHLLGVMTEVERERFWPVVANSPAELILHGVHLSSAFTPPPLFKKYILPYYEEFMPVAHDAGKAVALHADNDTSLIAEMIEQAGWDMAECFVTAPMVPFTLERARQVWGNRVIIWGGLPSLMMAPSVSEEDFRAYMHNLLDVIAPGDAFILGVADNVMPDSVIERVLWVTELLEKRGQYPIAKRG